MNNKRSSDGPWPTKQERVAVAESSDKATSTNLESTAKMAVQNDEHLRKIFIGGLPTQTSPETLRNFFSQFGAVADAVVMRDPVSNHSRGFGFVTFVDPGSVENVQSTRPHIIDYKTVETKPALPRLEFNKPPGMGNDQTNKIFLGGLKDCHTEAIIRDYFSKFGPIMSIKLLMDKETGRKRGFGFLEYEDIDSAERSLVQTKHVINSITVEVKKSAQRPDPVKRLRFPVGGAARAGYGPPQPAVMDRHCYNAHYNPYVAQSSLPPSAYINGWASYVTPVVPSVPHIYYAPIQSSGHGAFGGTHSAYNTPQNSGGSSNLIECVAQTGPKPHQTSTNQRPINDYKSVQAAAAAAAAAAGAAVARDNVVDIGAGGDAAVAADKKWSTENNKVVKPSQSLDHSNRLTR
ncbi:LOW QUALITY PROTEIN: ribonucleoprotein RB97D [Drosophila obscura]|uniref:LOW QUALITY PROTEIN: ribonucleoprotein RB97D n=1 Tax=Drosophila obscura TaxID=7282 RepID=UPI001BB2515A|nr:LOW QUALITY PROTEIN: ribonucleoprotein RB97D [Drosophila obscura]